MATDAHAEAGQAHVAGGDVLFERLHECGRDEGDDADREGQDPDIFG